MSRNTIVWTDIPVSDMKRATDFYAKLMAQPVELQTMEDWQYSLLPGAKEGAASGCLAPADEDNKPSRTGPLIYLNVSGRLEEAVHIAGDSGGEVLRPPHPIGPYGFRAIIIDTEGNRIALHSD